MPSADPRPPPAGDIPALKRAIRERVREFDVCALLDLLAAMGYRPADIAFRSHLARSPQPTLLHSIEFTDDRSSPGPAAAAVPRPDAGDGPHTADGPGSADIHRADIGRGDDSRADDSRADDSRGDDSRADGSRADDDSVDIDVSDWFTDLDLPEPGDDDVTAVHVIDADGRELHRDTRRYRAAIAPAVRDTDHRVGHDDITQVSASPPESPEFASPPETPSEPLGAGALAVPPPAPAPVVVTVNLGLLSCRSPLPSYFDLLLREFRTYEPLVELIRLLDRALLGVRLTSDRPDRVFGDWSDTARDFISVHGLDSPLGLDWLFRHVFPDLRVTVRRTADDLGVRYTEARLGWTVLGQSSFGSVTRVTVHDFEVTLACDDAMYQHGVPWIREVDDRMQAVVFPLLHDVCMNLTVILEIRDQTTFAAFRDDVEIRDDSYVGYDPLRAADGDSDLPPRRIIMYRGSLPRSEPGTHDLELALVRGEGVNCADDYREETSDHAPGFNVALELRYRWQRYDHGYRATVCWGARRWYRDEPYGIHLRYDRLSKANPTARHHPNLWSLLVTTGRRLVAERLAREVLDEYGERRVTLFVVDALIARGRESELHALLLSGHDVGDGWDADAWERFMAWTAP